MKDFLAIHKKYRGAGLNDTKWPLKGRFGAMTPTIYMRNCRAEIQKRMVDTTLIKNGRFRTDGEAGNNTRIKIFGWLNSILASFILIPMSKIPESDRIKTNSKEDYFLRGFVSSYLNFKRSLTAPTKGYKIIWRHEAFREGVELGWFCVSEYYREVLNRARPKLRQNENLEEFLQEIDKIFKWIMEDEWQDEPPSLEKIPRELDLSSLLQAPSQSWPAV